jgi:signal peptidase I
MNEPMEPINMEESEQKNGAAQNCFEWAEALVSSIVIVIAIFTFLFRVVAVSGPSMETTLMSDDRIVLTNLFYTPQPGDIVVMSHGAQFQEPLVKRVIAVEGQVVDINISGEVFVDNQKLEEPYIQGALTFPGAQSYPLEVPEGYVFVMGDNRPVSLDSRSHEVGLIDKRNIIGKAQCIIYPFNRIGGLS